MRALRAAGCVFAEEEAALLGALPLAERERAVQRRLAGTPLEHVLGWAEVAGVRIAVANGVFVPRRRTEELIDAAARLLAPGGVLLDVCCGSGAIARVLLQRCRPRRVHACDIDRRAVACTAENLGPWLGADAPGPLAGGGAAVAGAGGSRENARPQVSVGVSDLLDDVPHQLRGAVTVMTANVPYVPTADLGLLPRDWRRHEPRRTHDGGGDGLDVLRRVLLGARDWLAPGGVALAEVAPHQGAAACEAARGAGLVPEATYHDDCALLLARRAETG